LDGKPLWQIALGFGQPLTKTRPDNISGIPYEPLRTYQNYFLEVQADYDSAHGRFARWWN